MFRGGISETHDQLGEWGGGGGGGLRTFTNEKKNMIFLSNFIKIDTFISKVYACLLCFVLFSSSVFSWHVLRIGHI